MAHESLERISVAEIFTINNIVVLWQVPPGHHDRLHEVDHPVPDQHHPVDDGALLHVPQGLQQVRVEPTALVDL